jgi:hypothetical protein
MKSRAERLFDLGAWLVVVGLVFEIVLIFVFHPEESLCEKMLFAIADVIIVVGVLVELHFGGVVQQEAKLETAKANREAEEARRDTERLRDKYAPRKLTVSQQKEIGLKLAVFENIRVDICQTGNTVEITSFAAMVMQTLGIAGWDLDTASLLQAFSMSGVTIVVSNEADPLKIGAAAIALRTELIGAGIDVRELVPVNPKVNIGYWTTVAPQHPNNPAEIRIIIGEKP